MKMRRGVTGMLSSCSARAVVAGLAFGVGLAALPALAQVDEIVVSATKRERSLQDVPIAVTPIDGELARNAGVTDLRDITRLAPSFHFTTGQSSTAGTTAYIRGIGTGADNPGFESAVGIFIDGVYRNRSNVGISELPEIERIEVLRGPQGTLFGKNTSAGALNVITAGPEFESRAFAEASYGNLNAWHLGAGATGPLVGDELAFRIDGKVRQRDGYIEDLTSDKELNNRDRWFLRGQLLWEPNADVSLRVIADYAEQDEFCCSTINLIQGPTAAAVNTIAALQPGLLGIVTRDRDARQTTVSPARDTLETVEEWGISGELNWDLGFANLTSITSYRDWQTERNQDIDFHDVDRAYRDGYETGFETFTQELRLQGENGWLNWLVGGFFADETLPLKDTIRFGADAAAYVDFVTFGSSGRTLFGTIPGPLSILGLANPGLDAVYFTPPAAGDGQQADNYEVETQTFAAFTHNEIQLADPLTFAFGLRLNHETKDISANLNSQAAVCDEMRSLFLAPAVQGLAMSPAGAALLLGCNPAIDTEGNLNATDSREETEWTGEASLTYEVLQQLSVYGRYAHGYKAGGYNLDRSSFDYTTFDGTGGPDLDQLAFEPEFVDMFEIGWKSTLFNRRVTLNGALFYQKFEDYQINYFSGFGFVTENAQEVISKGVELDMIAQPLDGLFFQGGVLYNEAQFGEDIGLVIGGNTVDGRTVNDAPRWVLTGATTYNFPIANTGLTGLAHLDVRWNSKYNTGSDLDPNKINDNYAIWNTRVGIAGNEGQWGLEFFVRNLTDEYYSIIAIDVPEQPGTYAAYPNEPRTFGVVGRVEF
ncbi:MAG: TonB-dependent receptor [Alphaproteobacteria bacterium]|nr:TonB-dependent receptor [Alphaproteobacteria bacterium]